MPHWFRNFFKSCLNISRADKKRAQHLAKGGSAGYFHKAFFGPLAQLVRAGDSSTSFFELLLSCSVWQLVFCVEGRLTGIAENTALMRASNGIITIV